MHMGAGNSIGRHKCRAAKHVIDLRTDGNRLTQRDITMLEGRYLIKRMQGADFIAMGHHRY